MADAGGYLSRPAPSGLADVVETILDKGVVIDAYARVSLLGIELLTIDARVTIASVDTYLRFAEATVRLELEERGGRSLPDLLTEGTEHAVEGVAARVVEGKVEEGLGKVGEKVGDKVEGAVEAVASKSVGVVEKAAGAALDAITPGDSDSE